MIDVSSAKTLDNQNLSKEIKMENDQSYDVRNRDNTIISSGANENCQEFRLGKTQAANLILPYSVVRICNFR